MNTAKQATLASPVFVVGPLRSGTTLLRLLLDHHPDMNFFGEFETAVSQGSSLNGWPDISVFHEFLHQDRQFRSQDFSVDTNLDYESLIKSFLEQAYERNPKKIIGASIHSRMDLIPRLWPKARYIHLLRDPRDVARSCIPMGWVGNVYEGAQYWLEPEQHWNIIEQSVPSAQLYTIRYEELVSDPEGELAKICEFLEIKYDENMLNLEGNTTYSRPDGKYANQWKKKLSPREISWVESRCSELMVVRKYSLETSAVRKPGIFERIGLKLQSRWYRIQFNIKHWGFFIWLAHIISKRTGPKKIRDSIQLKINAINSSRLK